ncbi:MAG: DUF4278 domain-containing protein [Xenococcaceae cyanobacterium MO_188.B19]|nr:DUF4278 domain-containing protein [Xenococcaceae cyanobacterium MO_188.B19]
MKLTYRGVQYKEKNQCLLTSLVETRKKEIVYRGNSAKARINPKFPWLLYIKQLFYKSEVKPIFDPITFWYNHKREFLQNCFYLDDLERLDRAWDLTIKIEKAQVLKSQQKTKLKYRGVTYYR